MELQIIESSKPKITFNEEEMEQYLTKELAKLENLVVTKETLKDDTKTKQELKKLADSVSRFRIDTTREMSTEIDAFAVKLKKLYKKIMEIHDAINEQIKAFEEERKNKRRKEVEELIAVEVEVYQLDEKHAAQLTLDESYLNKSAKDTKITADLKNRAEVLKIAQDTVVKNRELIISTCDLHKDTVTLDVDGYLMLFDSGREVFEIVNMINSKVQAELARKQEEERQRQQAEFEAQQKAQREAFEAEQRERENAMRSEYEAKQAELLKQAQEPVPEPAVHSEPMATNNGIYTNILQISGTSEQMYKLHDFLTSNEFEFKRLK